MFGIIPSRAHRATQRYFQVALAKPNSWQLSQVISSL